MALLIAGSHQGITKPSTASWTSKKGGVTASLTQKKSGDISKTALITQLKSDAQDGDLQNKKAIEKEFTN